MFFIICWFPITWSILRHNTSGWLMGWLAQVSEPQRGKSTKIHWNQRLKNRQNPCESRKILWKSRNQSMQSINKSVDIYIINNLNKTNNMNKSGSQWLSESWSWPKKSSDVMLHFLREPPDIIWHLYIVNGDGSMMYYLVGGWPTPLKNDGLRQLGWWHFQYMESHKIHVPNHQPVMVDVFLVTMLTIMLKNSNRPEV